MGKRYIFFLIIILFKFNHSTIIFKTETILPESDNNNIHSNIIRKHFLKDIYIIFGIGEPIQNIPILIEPQNTKFEIKNYLNDGLGENLSFIFFDEKTSLTYKTEGCKETINDFDDIETICLSNDTFSFYQDINMVKKIKFNNFYFKLIKDKINKNPGIIGLGLFDKNYDYENNFLKICKNYNLIKNYFWYFDYNRWNDTKGKLIIGALPHESQSDKYDEEDLISTNILIDSTYIRRWRFEFDKIYIKNNDYEIDLFYKKAEFAFDSDIIIGTNELEMNLIQYYLSEKLDKNIHNDSFLPYNNSYSKYRFYYFDLGIKDNLFELVPSIKIYSNIFNYTFEIAKDELFVIEDNYIYLNILFPILEQQNQQTYFIFGKSFTLKYPFVYNSDLKEIGFYKKFKSNKKKDDEKNYILVKLLIIFVCSIILILIGLKLGKMIYGSRKKRAYELSDDYEYTNEKNKNDNNNINDNE